MHTVCRRAFRSVSNWNSRVRLVPGVKGAELMVLNLTDWSNGKVTARRARFRNQFSQQDITEACSLFKVLRHDWNSGTFSATLLFLHEWRVRNVAGLCFVHTLLASDQKFANLPQRKSLNPQLGLVSGTCPIRAHSFMLFALMAARWIHHTNNLIKHLSVL